MSDPVLRTLGRYEIQGEIGRGTMGVVYRALDPALGRAVALKTVHLAFSVPEAEREVYEKRFLSEAKIAAALSHPGIVVVHDVGRDTDSGTLYIALEYLRGETLDQMIAGGRPLDWREALRITAAVAEGLDHAHSHGVVHRDVKPANIMVLASGEPKIMDFGIAKVPTSQLTSAGEFFGTPSYMSPEQAQGEPVDARCDIFSLGCVLYLLLTGRRAFDGPNVPAILTRVTHKDPPPPSSLVRGLPADVDRVVARAMAKKPGDRYSDARSLAEDIGDLRAGRPPQHLQGWQSPPPAEGTLVSSGPWPKRETEPLHAAPASPADRTGVGRERRGIVVVATVASLAALLGLFALFRAPSPRVSPGESPTPERTPAPGETPEASPSSSGFSFPFFGKKEPAKLEVVFEHSIQYGTLKVWVDDDPAPVIEEKLERRTVKRIPVVGFRIRRGTVTKVVDLSPGDHVVRVEVEGDGETRSRHIRGTFESGEKRRLEVNRGGLPLMKKELSLEWS